MQNKVKTHQVYKNAEGKRLCGVTTIIGLLAKPQLIAWANRIGLDGIEVSKYVDDLAGVGTLAHEMVFCHLTGKELNTDEYSKNDIDRAENAMISFLEWTKDKKIEVILAEAPMVSEKHQFGGMCDLYCKINGEHLLVDFKTSGAIYDEMMIQLGAYKMLLEENGHKVDKAMIVRIGRDETEGFETRTVTDFTKYQEIFKHLLSIYELRRK
jgi:hypothetical protein